VDKLSHLLWKGLHPTTLQYVRLQLQAVHHVYAIPSLKPTGIARGYVTRNIFIGAPAFRQRMHAFAMVEALLSILDLGGSFECSADLNLCFVLRPCQQPWYGKHSLSVEGVYFE